MELTDPGALRMLDDCNGRVWSKGAACNERSQKSFRVRRWDDRTRHGRGKVIFFFFKLPANGLSRMQKNKLATYIYTSTHFPPWDAHCQTFFHSFTDIYRYMYTVAFPWGKVMIRLALEDKLALHGSYSCQWQTSCTRRLKQSLQMLFDPQRCWERVGITLAMSEWKYSSGYIYSC